MHICRYCKCLLSVGEISKGKLLCESCEKNSLSNKKWFDYYGWLKKEEAELLNLKWEDDT